jgi:DNA-binding transcriptional MerR regulator
LTANVKIVTVIQIIGEEAVMQHEKYSYLDISQELSLPKRTPRFWVTEGLMKKPEKREGRRKYFSEAQMKEAKALKRLLKDYHKSFEWVKELKQKILENWVLTPPEDYPYTRLMSILDDIAWRDRVQVQYLLNRFMEGSQYINCPKIENIFPFHKKQCVDFDWINHAYGDAKIAKTWEELSYKLGEPTFSLFRKLREVVDLNISKVFPFSPPLPKKATPSDRMAMKKLIFHTILSRISDEVSTLNVLYYPDRSKSLAFVEQYIEGLYLILPYYLRNPFMPFMGWPLVIKIPLAELTPRQLKKSESLGVYTDKEVAKEAERRIKQHGEDVKFLRYKVVKNLRRRKK